MRIKTPPVDPWAHEYRLVAGARLRDLDGKPSRPAALDGRIVVLHFWSMHCPHEWQLEPRLKKLVEQPAALVYGTSLQPARAAATAR